MTVELIIANKDTEVMARDSAVTAGDKKIFKCVNKLFIISNELQMIFGNAQIENKSMGTIIKEFSRNYDDTANHYEFLY